jgi:hypothetical protein
VLQRGLTRLDAFQGDIGSVRTPVKRDLHHRPIVCVRKDAALLDRPHV